MVIKELGPKDWMEKMMRNRGKLSMYIDTNDVFELEKEFDKLFVHDKEQGVEFSEFDEIYFCGLENDYDDF